MSFFTGGLFYDTVFGLGTCHWDHNPPSREVLASLLKSFSLINECPEACFAALFVHWRHNTAAVEALEECGYKVNPVFWYKTDQNVVGDKRDLTWAVELCAFGLKRSADLSINRCILSDNPTERHNIIKGPSLHKMGKYLNGGVVNQHESPPYVAGWFAARWTHPGDWVLICGAGAGGDAKGFLDAGCNVVLVEKDAQQFEYLCSTMSTYEATIDAREAKAGDANDPDENKVPVGDGPACPNCPDHKAQTFSACIQCSSPLCDSCLHDYAGRVPEDGREFCSAECFTAFADSVHA